MINFILFLLSLFVNYIFFPIIIGILAIPFPNSILLKFKKLQLFITSVLYGLITGIITLYFMSKPSVEYRWLYILFGVFFSLGLPYRIEAMSGQRFMMSDTFIILYIWIFSIVSFILTLLFF
ncbi:hypothetical protein [Thermodesulfovibrio yellowstonii]|uniref:hypothetical protein n=1 Tax=Thermodesulfovibrio yellowstonii TaxID=28262 RepID=UPI003C7E04DC